MAAESRTDRDGGTPFHLKVFYRLGSHHRPDEFAFPSSHHSSHMTDGPSLPPPSPLTYLPSPYLTLYTWPSCTLSELSHLFIDALRSEADHSNSSATNHHRPPSTLAPSSPSDNRRSSFLPALSTQNSNTILPSPAVGTRLVFRLFYPDPASVRNHQHRQNRHWAESSTGASAARIGEQQPRYTSRELGSVVIGGDGMGRIPSVSKSQSNGAGPGVEAMDTDHEESREGEGDAAEDFDQPGSLGGDPEKTLAASRFVIGDYLSIAVLPPGRNGEVASVSAVRPPPSASAPMFSAGGSGGGDEGLGRRFEPDGYGDAGGGGRMNGWHGVRPSDGSRRRGRGHFGDGDGEGDRVPRGDWRRGERLPPMEPRGHRGRGRRGGW